MKRRLQLPVAIDKAKAPILDQVAAGEPLVGPGEDKSAGDPGGKRGAHLPGQDLPLFLGTVVHRVDAELGQDQRLVDGEVVQSRYVATKCSFIMEIDVEAEKIGEVDRQVFG